MTKSEEQEQSLKVELTNNLFQFFNHGFFSVHELFDQSNYDTKVLINNRLKELNQIIEGLHKGRVKNIININ